MSQVADWGIRVGDELVLDGLRGAAGRSVEAADGGMAGMWLVAKRRKKNVRAGCPAQRGAAWAAAAGESERVPLAEMGGTSVGIPRPAGRPSDTLDSAR